VYPVCLNITGKLCLVVGGGTVAWRKVQGLLAGSALVRVISPRVTADLFSVAQRGEIEWRKKVYESDDLQGAFLVFATTDNREVQEAVIRQAQLNGQLINVADAPESCSFQVPAAVRRGDLILAVSTNGRSPAVAALIRQQLEDEFGPEYQPLLNLMSAIRKQLIIETDAGEWKKKLYKNILHSDIIHWIRTGRLDKALRHIQDVLGPEVELNLSELKQDML